MKAEKLEPKKGMTVKGLKVTNAYLHQALAWSGFPAERTISQTKFKGVVMHLVPQGLLLEAKGKLGLVQCLVPMPNVANCVLEDRIEVEGS